MTMTNTPVLSDSALAERLQKAIAKRDSVHNRAIRVQAEVDMAEKNAQTEALDAKNQFDVDNLAQLRELAVTAYGKDLADVMQLEKEVEEYESMVVSAEKILSDASI